MKLCFKEGLLMRFVTRDSISQIFQLIICDRGRRTPPCPCGVKLAEKSRLRLSLRHIPPPARVGEAYWRQQVCALGRGKGCDFCSPSGHSEIVRCSTDTSSLLKKKRSRGGGCAERVKGKKDSLLDALPSHQILRRRILCSTLC